MMLSSDVVLSTPLGKLELGVLCSILVWEEMGGVFLQEISMDWSCLIEDCECVDRYYLCIT